MDLGNVCWALGVAFWSWVLFLRGAEQIDGTLLWAYLVGHVHDSIDGVVLLKLIAAAYLVLSATILAMIVIG